MAQNGIRILRDDGILRQFKANAFNVARQFDIHNILPLYEDIYQLALSKNYEKN